MAEQVALIQCGDHWENQRRVLSLATSLASDGWDPVVMPYARHEGALFLRHGIDVAPLTGRGGQSGAERARRMTFALGRRQTYRSVDVADIARIERARLPHSFQTRAARLRWRLALAERVDALHAALNETRPARVYVWNGLTGVVAHALRQLSRRRGIDTAFLERGLLPDSVFVDPAGTGGSSQLHRRTLEELTGDAAITLPTPSALDADLRARHGLQAERLIFVPLQVQRDTNIFFHSDAVRSMRELLERVTDALRDQNAVVVARPHPEESEPLELPQRPNLRYIAEGSVESWCDAADLVLTINSTVGLTALLRGRPVVALGRAIYTNKGLCRELRLEELPAVLADPATYARPDPARVERFYRALIGSYTVRPGVASHPPSSRRTPSNPHGIEPADFAARWRRALAHARRHAATGVALCWHLTPRDTLRLTYRKQREPIDRARIAADLANLLGVDHFVEAPSAPHVTITPQTTLPPVDPRTLLVLDPHLQPHAGWLARR